MLHVEKGNYEIIPIDGGAIFHTGNQDKENYTFSPEETLLSSPLLFSLFSKKELCAVDILKDLNEYYYFCIQNCKQSLDNIISQAPSSWQINKETEILNLEQFLFRDNWIFEVWETFTLHLQLAINHQ